MTPKEILSFETFLSKGSKYGNKNSIYPKLAAKSCLEALDRIKEGLKQGKAHRQIFYSVLDFLCDARWAIAKKQGTENAIVFGLPRLTFNSQKAIYTPLAFPYDRVGKALAKHMKVLSSLEDSKTLFSVNGVKNLGDRDLKKYREVFPYEKTCKFLIGTLSVKVNKTCVHGWSVIKPFSEGDLLLLHAEKKGLKCFYRELEKVFSSILTASEGDLEELIIYFEYLFSITTPMVRGSASIREILVKALLKFHHKPLLPITEETTVDLEAFSSVSYREFRERYLSLNLLH